MEAADSNKRITSKIRSMSR